MDFPTYIPLALRTAPKAEWWRADAQHATLGLITELGEFTTNVKRMFAYNKELTDEMRLHMIEEGGDVMWYVPLGLRALSLDALPDPDVDLAPDLTEPAGNLPDLCTQMVIFAGSFSVFTMIEADEAERRVAADSLLMIVRCMEAAALILGTTGEHMREQNITKLRVRFPDKFNAAAAEARADKGGLTALES